VCVRVCVRVRESECKGGVRERVCVCVREREGKERKSAISRMIF